MPFPSTPRDLQIEVLNGITYQYNASINSWLRYKSPTANVVTVDTANITSNTTSISSTTGALRVAGGAGIAGNVYAGAVYTNSYFYANGAAFSGGGSGGTGFTGSIGFTGSVGAGFTGSVGFTGSQGAGFTGSAGVGTNLNTSWSYLSTGATSGTGWQKVPIDVSSVDEAGWWDNTNKYFKPTRAGWYLVSARARTASAIIATLAIGKNGSHVSGMGNDTNANQIAIGGSQVIYLNGTTDYVDLRAFVNSSGVNYTSGTFDTYLQISGPLQAGPIGFTGSAGTGFTGSIGGTGFTGSASAGGAGDTNFNNVSLLLHFDGANGDTRTFDSSAAQNTLVFGNPVSLSNAQAKFGTTSLAVTNNSGSFVYTPGFSTGDQLDLSTGNPNWTIEAWAYPTAVPSGTNEFQGLVLAWGPVGYGAGWAQISLYLSNNGKWAGQFNSNNTGGGDTIISSSANATLNAWTHLALTRSGNTAYFFVNGVQQGTSNNISNGINPSTTGWYMGQGSNNTYRFIGFIDEVRITKGIPRYTANFTPANAAFPDFYSGIGFTGSVGSTGFTGSVGTIGFTGSSGSSGTTGFTGSAGAGFTGSQGSTGITYDIMVGNISVTIGAGGGGGSGATAGSAGGTTTVNVGDLTWTATGGGGGPYQGAASTGGSYSFGGGASGLGANGGSGAATTGDKGGTGGGAINGVNSLASTSSGSSGAQATDFANLYTALAALGIATTGPGAGSSGGSGTANNNNGGNATGFGCGGGGGSYYGGNGGAGLYGGGGGGAGAYTLSRTGGAGGNGAVIFNFIGAATPYQLVTTSGNVSIPSGATGIIFWAVGGGGGGAGVPATDTTSGTGGAAGGIIYSPEIKIYGIRGYTGSAGTGFTGSAGTTGFTGSAGTGGSGGAGNAAVAGYSLVFGG